MGVTSYCMRYYIKNICEIKNNPILITYQKQHREEQSMNIP